MIYLLLAVICSTCLLVVFKLIQRNNVDKLPVIIVNYFTAAAIGALITPGTVSFGYFISQAWFPFTVMLGVLFITIFYTVALSTQVSGIAVTSVAFKLSLVIPVAAAFYLYNDKIGFMKISGIVLALVAIFLTSKSEAEASPKAKMSAMLLPAIVFTGSGICDAVFNYMQQAYLSESDISSFLIILFLTAGVAGSVLFSYGVIKGATKIQWKSLLLGILLGIPNYGSAHFMMLALETSGAEPSALWPLNNIGIILASTSVALWFFGERVNRSGVIGIILAVMAIALIALSEYAPGS